MIGRAIEKQRMKPQRLADCPSRPVELPLLVALPIPSPSLSQSVAKGHRSGRGLIRVLARASRIILDPVPIDGAHPGVVCGLGFVCVAALFAVRVCTAQLAVRFVARAR